MIKSPVLSQEVHTALLGADGEENEEGSEEGKEKEEEEDKESVDGNPTPGKGPFKCYVTLEGVGGCMPKRYEALRGGGGGVTSALRNVILLLLTLLGLPSCPRVRRGFLNNLASISNNMFLCTMLTPKTCSTLIIIRNSYNLAV